MKRLSWKYVAGLIDGEGCIDVQRSLDPRTKVPGSRGGNYSYIRPRLRIGMAVNALPVLEMLQANFGGSIDRRASSNPNWQDSATWTLCGKAARSVLQNVRNHLIIKREQCSFCIWMIDEVMGKHVSEQLRERLCEELKVMKRDPQRLSETAIREAKQCAA